ncbi:MAG: hypothetical protein SCK70_06010 [bacterium]|nr:hypothetical protein [bacterium]
MAEHYCCFIDPCRVSHPKDKGKVERDVQTVRQQFRKLLLIHPNITLAQANQLIQQWAINDYGQKDHGTTHWKPYPTFNEQERPRLKQLPNQPFDMSQWKQAKVHSDTKQFYFSKIALATILATRLRNATTEVLSSG